MPSRPKRQLAANDLARHLEMVEHGREAEVLTRRAQEMLGEAAELVAACNVWGRDLARRYEMAADEGVLEDGSIQRIA